MKEIPYQKSYREFGPGWYMPTDGVSLYPERERFFKTELEYKQAQEQARMLTGGNIFWVPTYIGA